MSPFTLSVETNAGTFQHGFHLGTDERLARELVEGYFRNVDAAALAYIGRAPKGATHVVTVALKRDGYLFDVFDGAWLGDGESDWGSADV
jgi:hypothetical protein